MRRVLAAAMVTVLPLFSFASAVSWGFWVEAVFRRNRRGVLYAAGRMLIRVYLHLHCREYQDRINVLTRNNGIEMLMMLLVL